MDVQASPETLPKSTLQGFTLFPLLAKVVVCLWHRRGSKGLSQTSEHALPLSRRGICVGGQAATTSRKQPLARAFDSLRRASGERAKQLREAEAQL